MSLSASVLSGLMQTNISAIAGISITNAAELQKFCDAMAKAVVDHVVGAGVVLPDSLTVSGASPGVTALPVTGTGKIS